MTIRNTFTLLSVFLLLTACRSRPPEAARPSQADLAALEGLPYLSWNEGADPTTRGVTQHIPESAFDGINLYTNDVDEAYLMGMDGTRLHTWMMPPKSRQCEYFELLKDGDILVTCWGQWLARLNWDSTVQWRLDQRVHHDLHRLKNGLTIVPQFATFRKYRGRTVRFDGLLWVSRKSRIKRRWPTFANLESLRQHHPASPLDDPNSEIPWKKSYDYYHLNTVDTLPDNPRASSDRRFRAGNILICLRNVNTILILDQDSLKPIWSWGRNDLEYPQMPTMLSNGNILIFDNGVSRGYSRVIELNPATEKIVWTYQADPPTDFFSKWRGSAQRLPNGNTLICEAERGRVFEVTAEGRTVWEFWNPEVRGTRRKLIYRMMRMDRSRVKKLIGRPLPSAGTAESAG
jgi:hypothetical protein